MIHQKSQLPLKEAQKKTHNKVSDHCGRQEL
jgi:hypothetical protein